MQNDDTAKGKAVFLNKECLTKMNDIKKLMCKKLPEMSQVKTSASAFLTACLCVLEAYMQNDKR